MLNISCKYDIWVYISNWVHILWQDMILKVEEMVLVSKIPGVNLNANIVMWLYVWINGPLALKILRSCMSSYHSSSPRVRLGLVFSPWTNRLHPHTIYKQKEKKAFNHANPNNNVMSKFKIQNPIQFLKSSNWKGIWDAWDVWCGLIGCWEWNSVFLGQILSFFQQKKVGKFLGNSLFLV